MDSNYGEFQGTDMDPGADFQSDFAEVDEMDDFDWDEEENDLVPILAASAVLAALVGGGLVLLGRRRKPTAEERIADLVETFEKRGKKGVESVTEAVSSARLGDTLGEAIDKARALAGSAGEAVSDGSLRSMLDDAVERARKAGSRLDVAGSAEDVSKQVRKEVRKGLKKARKAAGNVDIDRKSTEQFLESIQKRVASAIETVRDDYAPKAAEAVRSGVIPAMGQATEAVRSTVAEQVMPAAQDVLERVQKDVLPAVEERAQQLDKQYQISGRARSAAKAATERGGGLGEMIKGLALAILAKVVDEIVPQARKAGTSALSTAREDVLPAVQQRAGEAAEVLREDVLPRVGETAAQAPEMLADLLQTARAKASVALEKAGPVAEDAMVFGAHRAQDAVELARKRADDVAHAANKGRSGVTGAVAAVGTGVKSAAVNTVDTTTYVTRQTFGILFWLAALGALVMLVFVPDKDRQKEIMDNVRQFAGEVREMWHDIQGGDLELEPPDATTTGRTTY
jgi:hypothetical protein